MLILCDYVVSVYYIYWFRHSPGVFILNLVPSGIALVDGRLRPDDRVLEINNIDVTYSSQDQAASIIQVHSVWLLVICHKQFTRSGC